MLEMFDRKKKVLNNLGIIFIFFYLIKIMILMK